MPSRLAPYAHALPARLAAAFLACGLALAGAGTAYAQRGSLPEPVIDPNMGASPSQAQQQAQSQPQPQSQSQSQSQPQGQMPQRQVAVQAPVQMQGQGQGQMPQRQLSVTAPVIQQTPAAQPLVQPPLQATVISPVVAASPRMTSATPPPPLGALESSLQDSLQMLAMAGARMVAPTQARVVVELGRLDPRLRLAPCEQIQPYLPPNQRMWGRTRIGIRCLSGPTKWNVSLPLTIRVFAPAYIAASDLPTGTQLTQEHLRLAETDIAGEAGFIFTQPEGWVGRHLAKGLMAGEALRSTDLKLRQWVQPGERVQVQATGEGYAVSGEGQAMGVGLEGQDVRIRFDNGRMVTGRTVGERKVEVLL
ncbi:flagella basal body P-ring formation protein FlgA [Roseateles sp. YR242]|uniref:flagellar basal body P-ring formation chaperone FlgA n=1 Tax=Roseateles sp. YR242 TaxID=1855305 RepID=UPI0008D1E635|nr:flagellar basal body P-ring formation chaperone FlgA [Roseateles sp. YR242]SEL44504.1 flagella basal body P-ring formation protein FlgA [Roseateles sp. YR242]